MKLLFIYGPPASGKLTVAREPAALTGYRLFHNHLVVDALECPCGPLDGFSPAVLQADFPRP